MLIVDAQIHLWRGGGAPPHHHRAPYLAEDAIREMDAAGITRSVNCPAIWDQDANDYAVEAASVHPDRFATMGWFPLDRAPDPDFLSRFLARPGMIGLRFVIARPLDCAAFEAGALDWIWRIAEQRALPVAFGIPKGLLPAVGEVAQRFPGARFMVDHLAVPASERLPAAVDHLDQLLSLAALPNLAVKATATASMSNLPYPFADAAAPLRRVFDAYGPDRMFWGSDFTRSPAPLRQCVTHFTEHLPWLRGNDLARVMGAALCDWLAWPVPTIPE